mmetsp:Transcript_18610/g.60145  ORF Transcript_18610/g.60145 Transcript_18610/m.60145 type:complete len:243 (+) Transcript_18610:967-1695(+)
MASSSIVEYRRFPQFGSENQLDQRSRPPFVAAKSVRNSARRPPARSAVIHRDWRTALGSVNRRRPRRYSSPGGNLPRSSKILGHETSQPSRTAQLRGSASAKHAPAAAQQHWSAPRIAARLRGVTRLGSCAATRLGSRAATTPRTALQRSRRGPSRSSSCAAEISAARFGARRRRRPRVRCLRHAHVARAAAAGSTTSSCCASATATFVTQTARLLCRWLLRRRRRLLQVQPRRSIFVLPAD